MGKRFTRSGALSIVLILMLVLAACSSGNGNGGAKTTDKGSNTKSGDKKIVIGLSLDTLQEERWQRDRDLFIAAAEALGAKVEVQAANSDDAKQISQAENLISQGVNVLVVVPHNAEATAAIVEKAHAAGIKVLAYDRLIKNSDLDLYVSFDNEKVGELQAEAILKVVSKGKFVYIGGSETDNNAHLFKKGAFNILQPLIDKGDIQVVFDQWTKDWNPANALSNMENALTANDNKIDAVVAANDGTAGGVIQALASQGLAGKIPVSGQDAELAAAQRIVEGTQTMTVYKPIKDLAQRAADLAVKMAKGEDVGADKTVNNGKIDVPSILLDPKAVDKSNMDATVIADGFHSKEDVYKNAK
ncbi:D-xylose transport system substrate-binding protein [Paenibacillus castaneae]|uniref:D-xylose ABC transporter substrate-binding protein n=1 Tax=Paenibacillus castaneae TaxID=474957 RepID=UPI000C9BE6B8|nr:D-xylose ABC transporter substrate-binding protein [Paenibacillus castaneae]NIK80376.1 D-xylose transport system substrate-binding protein [Paenibacillus castaneae]